MKNDKNGINRCKCSEQSKRSNEKHANDGVKCENSCKGGAGENCCCHEHSCGVDEESRFGALKVFVYVVGLLVLAFAFLGELGFVNKWLSFCCSAVVYFLFGKDVWIGAYGNIKRKKFFTEFTLMCAATLGAVCLGEFADAAAVVYLYSLGENMQGEAYRRSSKNIASLIEVTEDRVAVVKDKKAIRVLASEVSVGDVVSVRMGDRILLDGVVVGGEGFADTSAITGESLPVELGRGSFCVSGALLVSGAVLVKVTEKYENSTVSKLKRAVETATEQKAVREKKITRFAEIFTPASFLVAVVILVVGLISGVDIAKALRPALVVLVASCPCSLVLSVPLAYFSGIGSAASRGIVFKSGRAIETAASIETLILDKTGTLTSSKPDFVGVIVPKEPPFPKMTLLDYSKAALLKSPHVLALTFCEKYTENVSYNVENVKNIGGRGVVCVVGGMKAAFGNKKLMDEIGVKVDAVEKSHIYVAIDGKYCGALVFDSKLKENALTQIFALRGNGIKRMVIMSGDNKNAVKAVADEIGVGEYYSELKPDEKLARMKYIYKEEKRSNPKGALAFCGDGVNDSAVIAGADVGIAMGSGADVTVECADVVIVDNNLERLNDMIEVAKKTSRIINQNIALSLAVKMAVVLFGLFGNPSLELAVAADVGAAVLTVLNSVRAGKNKKISL